MARIGPDPGQPELLRLLKLVRLGGLTGNEPVGAAPAPPAPEQPRPAVPVDGPRPGDPVPLRDLQRLLRASLELVGPLDELLGRLVEIVAADRPQLRLLLPGSPAEQRAQLAQALAWLVDNLDRPAAVAAGCGQLGAVLRELGVPPQQLQLLGPALAEAMRAALGPAWRTEYATAWRETWSLAVRWLDQGAGPAGSEPVFWTAPVISHDLRRSDLAVLRLRPYLPYPYRAGQHTGVQLGSARGSWRPYSIAVAPGADNVLELHVRAKGPDGTSGALVHRTAPGDVLRLRAADGTMTLDRDPGRDLLLIAGDTGVAPFKALLGELARTGDERAAVLFWGVRTLADLYDFAEIDALARACRRATVVPVVSEGDPGPYPGGLVTDAVAAYGRWSAHAAYIAGPPAMVHATRAVLAQLSVPADRVHHDNP